MIPLRDSLKRTTFPFVNWCLLIGNLYVFYKEVTLPAEAAVTKFIYIWGLVPVEFWSDIPTHADRLVTSMFLHGGWMHVLSNMLFLHIFGDNVEDRLGHVRYLLFYVLAGIGAGLVQAYATAGSSIPMIGASGAIAGILGAYFFFYPRAKVLTLIPLWLFSRIVEIPAFLFLGVWIVLQALNGMMTVTHTLVQSDLGGIAWWAHLGGFGVGIILGPLLAIGRPKSRSRY